MTTARTLGLLAVIPALPAVPRPGGRFLLTRKFVDGMSAYADRWGGPVLALMDRRERATEDLDHVEVAPGELPFGVVAEPFSVASLLPHLRPARVVLGGPHYKLVGLAAACRRLGAAAVYNVEYSLRTRLQIARADVRNPLRLLRRAAWELGEERRYRHEIRQADGVQCNGAPAFETYRGLSPDPLLYFDSRVSDGEMPTPAQLARANTRRLAGGPLRLAFAGRLNAIKGADDLVPFAAELRARGVPFSLRIFGAGPLEARLRQAIERTGLGDRVRLEGVLDFHERLLPALRDEVDLFVCCHRQGDPSCTYVETLAAGVPIAGYANVALAGLLRHARGAGWTSPMRDPARLAALVARRHGERPALAAAATAALAFARGHGFRRTFERRIDHLAALARRKLRGMTHARR